MKAYVFPLGEVLRIRRLEKDRAAAELFAARRTEVSAGMRRDATRAACSTLAAPPPAAVPAAFLAWRERCARAGIAATGAVADHREAFGEVTRRQDGWAATARGVAALEHLDERRRAEHRRSARRAEAVATDDLVSSRRSRP